MIRAIACISSRGMSDPCLHTAREILQRYEALFEIASPEESRSAIDAAAQHAQLVLDQHQAWSRPFNSPLLFTWHPFDLTGLHRAIAMGPLRGDEIVFPHLAVDSEISWAYGHARSMLTWGLTLHHSDQIADPWPTAKRGNKSDGASLIWWAQRINLRVYGAA
jgi:hypothetical protein